MADAAYDRAKAPTMALVVLLVVTTTPYPRIFALFSRFLPALVAESLLMAYRAIFVLLELTRRLLLTLRLRGGLGGGSPWQRLKNLSIGLGLVLVHSMDYLQRLYMVMRLRGYSGHLVAAPGKETSSPSFWRKRNPPALLWRNDAPLFAVALVIVASAPHRTRERSCLAYVRFGSGECCRSGWSSALPNDSPRCRLGLYEVSSRILINMCRCG